MPEHTELTEHWRILRCVPEDPELQGHATAAQFRSKDKTHNAASSLGMQLAAETEN